MQREPRGRQRGAAIVGEGAAHCATVAPHDFRLVVGTPLTLPFERTDATHPLFQAFLGMAIGFRDGLGGFTQRMALTPLVRHSRQGLRHGGTDGGLAIRDGCSRCYLKPLIKLYLYYQ